MHVSPSAFQCGTGLMAKQTVVLRLETWIYPAVHLHRRKQRNGCAQAVAATDAAHSNAVPLVATSATSWDTSARPDKQTQRMKLQLTFASSQSLVSMRM